jgi:ectoine hydroxylase-related dioxygenase (phytanoyl-CoA dioxygenase family)
MRRELLSFDAAQAATFDAQGYLVVKSVLDAPTIAGLRARFDPLFRGEFETGVYPDEWYWRDGMSLPEATRHMGNAWKSDLTVARLVLEPAFAAAAARLAGWSGARLGLDTIWMKPPHTRAIALHQDGSYMDFLEPAETLTCWFTLDDTRRDAGTIEYVEGSHRWVLTGRPDDFHLPEGGHRSHMLAAARAADVAEPQVVPIEVPAGSLVFHHGRVWHGSGPNVTGDIMRRSIAIHLLPATARYAHDRAAYIYGRYQRPGERVMDEAFFPILWQADGYRTPWLDGYLQTGTKREINRAA